MNTTQVGRLQTVEVKQLDYTPSARKSNPAHPGLRAIAARRTGVFTAGDASWAVGSVLHSLYSPGSKDPTSGCTRLVNRYATRESVNHGRPDVRPARFADQL
jgi:hypothetical protein